MRYSRGKWIASCKDTWSVETTLNKIILAYLEKLQDCLLNASSYGVAWRYMEQQALIDGIEEAHEADVDKAALLFLIDIEELIWVFSDNEPNIEDYNFNYDLDKINTEEFCSNPEESDRYGKDMEAYKERKEKGYRLFGEVYQDLDW